MLGELKHGELKPRGFPQACYSSQAACETGDRPWDTARPALAKGSCRQTGELCRRPVHRSPGGGSAARPAPLSAALGRRPAEFALRLSPWQGEIFLAGAAWPQRRWGRRNVRRQAQGEKGNLQRNYQSTRDTSTRPKQLHKCQLTACKGNL